MEENGQEFFEIGGDAELVAFMFRNPGLTPTMKSLKEGDVGLFAKGGQGISYGTRAIHGAIKKRLGSGTLSYVLAAHFARGFEEERLQRRSTRMC